MKKVCVLGCGKRAKQHAKRLAGKVELAFASKTPRSAKTLADENLGSSFATFDAALESGVDAVFICSPPEFHASQIRKSLTLGKDVIVESPICTTPEELKDIEDLVEGHSSQLFMVAENSYYKPSTKIILNWIEEGYIGRVEKLRLQKMYNVPEEGWRSRNGALLQGGIHLVAMISAILDADPESVGVNFPGNPRIQNERTSHLRLKYPGSIEASLDYSWETPSLPFGLFQTSTIEGDAGHIQFESNGLFYRLKGTREETSWTFGSFNGEDAMIADLLASLETKKPISDFKKARRDHQIVFRAYEAER